MEVGMERRPLSWVSHLAAAGGTKKAPRRRGASIHDNRIEKRSVVKRGVAHTVLKGGNHRQET